ncbi:MAG TPA: hypothetical protein VGC76_06485 [Pyrinomonadaceae bacterium]|jgi:hypothetical protein
MKSLIFIAGLILMSFTFAFAKPANYSGTWTLDFKQSKNLPPFYANVKSHKLSITQNEKTLNVAVEVDAGQGAPDNLSFVYNLDGSETKTETGIRTPGGMKSVPTTLKAETAGNGNLKITITREITMPDGAFKGVTIENWELSADGKTLTIHRTDEMPRGKMEADMVFVKV